MINLEYLGEAEEIETITEESFNADEDTFCYAIEVSED